MKVTITEQGNKVLVAISGELETAVCEDLSQELAPLSGRGALQIEMDLSKLTFISSSALRVFLSIAKEQEAAGGSVKVTAITPMVYSVFDLTGFSRIFLDPDTKVVA